MRGQGPQANPFDVINSQNLVNQETYDYRTTDEAETSGSVLVTLTIFLHTSLERDTPASTQLFCAMYFPVRPSKRV